jgi:serine/threonine-protein kinase PknG
VAAELPGELAPILAMATARERGGDHAGAEALYDLVSATDAGYATAAFGLARARRTGRDRPGAAAALHRVPAKSSAYQAAQVALCAVCSEDGSAGEANFSDLVLASDALERITGDPVVRAALTRDILTSALAAIKRGASPDREIRLAGVEVDEDSIRLALERVCRTLAKLSPTDVERIALVDQANVYRPRTWL